MGASSAFPSAAPGANVDITSLQGVATNSLAAAGKIGEILETVVTSGSAVSLTTDTAKTVASVSLTAGDWDVVADLNFALGASTTCTRMNASISATTDTLDSTVGNFRSATFASGTVLGNASDFGVTAGPVQIRLSATTTYYAVARATFGVSTATAYGRIRARRMR